MEKNFEFRNEILVEEPKQISNGDIIKVVVTSDAVGSQTYDMKLVEGEKEFEVSGLGKGMGISAFDSKNLEICCTGANGYGYVEVSDNRHFEKPVDVEFEVKDNGTFSNGDKAVIGLRYDLYELANLGYFFEEDEMVYEVNGLGDHVITTEQVPVKELKECFLNAWNGSWSFFAPSYDVSYECMYLGVMKDDAPEKDDKDFNELIIVGSYKDENTGKKAYCHSTISDLIQYPGGVVEVNGSSADDIYMEAWEQYGYELSELEDILHTSANYTYQKL